MDNDLRNVRSRIGIATDEPISGRGLLSVLQEDGGYRVIWLPVVLDRMLQSLGLLNFDVLLIDMACDFPTDVVARLRAAGCTVPVVLWQRDVSSAGGLNRQDEGCVVLDKRCGPEMLPACLQSVMKGRAWTPMESPAPQIVSEPPPSSVHLSKREVELMRLVSEGLSNRQIGERLNLTEGSVKVYFSRLFRKLGVRDRVGLAVYSLQHVWDRPTLRIGQRGSRSASSVS